MDKEKIKQLKEIGVDGFFLELIKEYQENKKEEGFLDVFAEEFYHSGAHYDGLELAIIDADFSQRFGVPQGVWIKSPCGMVEI